MSIKFSMADTESPPDWFQTTLYTIFEHSRRLDYKFRTGTNRKSY